MHEIDEAAEAMRDCSRCGGRAFYWRSAIVAANPRATRLRARIASHQPAWTCLNCGYVEPHERRTGPPNGTAAAGST